jgi:hypothetical protein
MARDLAGGFEVAACVLVERNSGGAEAMVADLAGEPGVPAPPLDHAERPAFGERLARELAPMSGGILPQRRFRLSADSGHGDVGVEVLGREVMGRDDVVLAVLLVEEERRPWRARAAIVSHFHAEDGAHARVGEEHDRNQRPVARADDGGRINGGEEGARLVLLEDRGLAGLLAVAGSPHGLGRVRFEHVPGDQPVEPVLEGRQVLLDGGGRGLPQGPRCIRRRAGSGARAG